MTRKIETPSALHGNVTDQGLTIEQEAYARCRAMGMSIEESITAAGMTVKATTARNWEKTARMKNRILELSKIITNNAILKSGVDREWVITRLMTVTDRCMQAEPVLDREGNPTGEYKFDSSGATKALELLGKTMRMFDGKDKAEDRTYENLSDDDIAALAGELAAQTGLLEAHAGASAPAVEKQVIEVQAVPEAGAVSQPWLDAPGEAVPSGQPVGQDVELCLRDRIPPDGAVPGLVGGQEVAPWSDGLGAG